MKTITDRVLLCFLLFITASLFMSSPHQVSADYYRLRILANSNSPIDQTMKCEMRDKVIALTKDELEKKKTKAAAREYITQNMRTIKAECIKIVNSYDKDYAVNLTQGDIYFPEKQYGNQVYPSGKYDALKIEIGEATGNNWWCVMFPPLCLVAFDDKDVPDDEVEYRSFIVEKYQEYKAGEEKDEQSEKDSDRAGDSRDHVDYSDTD